MRIKYNRVSTLQQSGDRFSIDTDNYDLVLMDKVSGTISFKDRPSGQELTKLVEEGKVTELIIEAVSYTHLRAHETVLDLVCRLLLEKKKKKEIK